MTQAGPACDVQTALIRREHEPLSCGCGFSRLRWCPGSGGAYTDVQGFHSLDRRLEGGNWSAQTSITAVSSRHEADRR